MESNFVFQRMGTLTPGAHLGAASVVFKPTGETFFTMQMEGETEEQWKLRAIAMVRDLLVKKGKLYVGL